MSRSTRYSPELRERAVRMVLDRREDYKSEWAALTAISKLLGMSPETLRTWVRRIQVDQGARPGLTTDERAQLKALEREVKDLRRTNQEVVRYIDVRKGRWGVEPICRALQFAPSTYYDSVARPPSARQVRDEVLKPEILRVHQSNCDGAYGAKKIWKQLHREGITVANCTVRRLMREEGLSGARRGRQFKVCLL